MLTTRGCGPRYRLLLANSPIPLKTTKTFRDWCLTELKQALKEKDKPLSAETIDLTTVARSHAEFRRYTDLNSLVEGAYKAVEQIADALAPRYKNLSALLKELPPSGPPLLAAAFLYFFRREVETNGELAQGVDVR